MRFPLRIGMLGVDGSGKTTQLKYLRSHLVRVGRHVELCKPHSVVRQEAQRIAASRGYGTAHELFDVNTLTIAGGLEFLFQVRSIAFRDAPLGVILFDKYTDSFLAIAESRGLTAFEHARLVFAEYPPLHLKFYLRVSLQECLLRIAQREGGHYDNEQPPLIESYVDCFDRLMLQDATAVTLDAHLDEKSLAKEVQDHVTRRLAQGVDDC